MFGKNDDKPKERVIYQARSNMILGCKKAILGFILLILVMTVSGPIIQFIGRMQVYLISQINLPLTRYTAIAVFVLTCAMIPLVKIKSAIKDVYNRSEGENAKVLTTYNEAFSGNKVISGYNLYDLKESQFKNLVNTVFGLKMKITQHVSWLSPLMHIIVSIGIALVIGLGSYYIVKGELSAGQFVSFITALIMLYTPIKGLGNNAKNISTCLCAMERVVSKLEKIPAIQDSEGAIDFPDFKDKIEFKDIKFSYIKERIGW